MEQILGVDVAASPTAVAHATLICETKHFWLCQVLLAGLES